MKTIACVVFACVPIFVMAIPSRAEEKLVLVAGGDAKLSAPFGTGFDENGTLFFVELTGGRVGKIEGDGKLVVLAGNGKTGSSGDGGPAEKAEFNGMHSLAVTRQGDIYIADTWNNRVRKIDGRTKQITNVAGTGHKGFRGDSDDAKKAEFGGIYCLALNEDGKKLYLADLDNRRIRLVDLASGIVTTVAGNGKKGVPSNGSEAKNAPLVDPRAVAVDGNGNVYILERSGHALRVVDASGKIRTVVGTGQAGTIESEGGPGLRVALNGPKHLCIDPSGNVVIADTENHRIVRYRPSDGTVGPVAGTGHKGTSGLDGPPQKAELNQPHGVTIGPKNELYISDSSNNRILKIVP